MRKYAFVLIAVIFSHNANGQWNPSMRFNTPRAGSLPINLHMHLNTGTKVTLELSHISQFDSIPDLDSLLSEIERKIKPIRDSIDNLLGNVRIDYQGTYFHITETEYPGRTFYSIRDTVRSSKEGFDTIRARIDISNTFPPTLRHRSLYVMFTGQYLKNIFANPEPSHDSVIALMKNHIKEKRINSGSSISSLYNWNTKEITFSKKRTNRSFTPDIYLAAQFVRGNWTPSTAVGFLYQVGDYDGKRKEYKLMWEPHFYFPRNEETNKVRTQRNDFITFRFYEFENKSDHDLSTPLTFSIGYLVRKKGDWYEKNTFKFSVPGVRYRSFGIEPEFFFNNLFKNFSPSLKLNYNFS